LLYSENEKVREKVLISMAVMNDLYAQFSFFIERIFRMTLLPNANVTAGYDLLYDMNMTGLDYEFLYYRGREKGKEPAKAYDPLYNHDRVVRN